MPEPTLNVVMDNVVSTLSGYLLASTGGLPSPTISFLSVSKKNPAIGNRVSTDIRAGFPVAAIKAGHLDADVQLQIWDSDPADIETEMNGLQARIMADKEVLRNQGFIKLRSAGSGISELVSGLNAWRKTTQFKLLFEYQYQDNDDALSIIHRIPVSSDLENKDSPDQEITTVIDSIQRWDNEEAWSLNIIANSRSDITVQGFNVLAYIPGIWNGNQVILERTNLDNPIPPTNYPTLIEFIAATTSANDPNQNARVIFASVSDFIGALTIDGSSFELGDWDEDSIGDQYLAYQQTFDNPIKLTQRNDIFRISYQAPPFDSNAVVYLRVKVT